MYHRAKVFGEAFDMPQQEKLGEAISGAAAFYSLPVELFDGGRFAVHAGWTGTISGTLDLQYTALANPDLATDTDWQTDSTWTPTDPAGSAGSTFVPSGNVVARWIRLKYTNALGSGTLWAWIVVSGSKV
jgi:hypothetical protein